VRAHDGDGSPETLVFSGDLGRYDAPIHPDPDALVDCDTLVIESTYGNRIHSNTSLEDQIHGQLMHTLGQGGIVLIPAFAVARAQLILSLLRGLMDAGRLPTVPVHLDSPMAIDVTQLYAEYAGPEGLEIERRELFGKWVRYHRTVDESRALNMMRGPRIIISSSGMMTGGRVLHHLKRLLPVRQNLIVLVGYQSAGTRGRSLLEGAKFLRIHGQDVPVRAPYLQVEGLSAHADAGELQRWALSSPSKPTTTFFVHGEPEGLEALQKRFQSAGLPGVVPALNQVFERRARGKWVRAR
jgi:metallo-beta-lactamase family protein